MAAGIQLSHETLSIQTRGRGTYDITERVQSLVEKAGVESGLCNLLIVHTSASLIITEGVDPVVRDDLERFLARLVPDGDTLFQHDDEGPDDMPAHVRSVLTATTLSVPIVEGELRLGTWQRIFVWEHRRLPHAREVVVTTLGR